MRFWLIDSLLSPIVRPLTRLLVANLAIPLFRLLQRRVSREQKLDAELQKDVEQWIRGSLLLFVATANFEAWLRGVIGAKYHIEFDGNNFWIAAGRLLVAVGVIETMPDQQLFSIIHPGPPPFVRDPHKGLLRNLLAHIWPLCRGLLCQHLNRSSSVFAIMAVIFTGQVGWTCYCLAVIQYLIIGLVTSRDRALDVLQAFDAEVARRREALMTEFNIDEAGSPDSPTAPRP